MNDLEIKLRKRFCKDCGIPINVFQEPYFSERLELFDGYFNCLKRWKNFKEELSQYPNQQDFLEHCNKVIDMAVEQIKNSEGYMEFNSLDMNVYALTCRDIPSNNFYKDSLVRRTFIILDMAKANFSALSHYNPEIYNNAGRWEEFLGRYTNSSYIKDSKYIRQVILGKCNSKRNATYERYLMEMVLSYLLNEGIEFKDVVYLSNEEIIIDITDQPEDTREAYRQYSYNVKSSTSIPLHLKVFTLHKIGGVGGYYKEIHYDYDRDDSGKVSGVYEFKCVSIDIYPMVIRKFLGQDITDNDKVFFYDGKLARYIEVPEISFD